jgi:hypothetical protein
VKTIIALIACIFLAGCSHTSVNTQVKDLLEPISKSDFDALVEKQTKSDEGYSGFYNTFQGHLTLLSSNVKVGALRLLAHTQNWDRKQASEEKEKDIQERAAQTKFFLSFFTPEKEHNQLDFGNSIWTISLEVKGVIYKGKAKKDSAKQSQLGLLFPTHSRFHKAYELVFDIPTHVLEESGGTVKLSSHLGEAEFKFP